MSTARMRRRRRLTALAVFLSITMVFSSVSTAYAAWNAYQTVRQAMSYGSVAVEATGNRTAASLPTVELPDDGSALATAGDVGLVVRNSGTLRAVVGMAVTPQMLDLTAEGRPAIELSGLVPSGTKTIAYEGETATDGLLSFTTAATLDTAALKAAGGGWYGPIDNPTNPTVKNYYVYVGSFEPGETVPALVKSVSLNADKLAPGALNSYIAGASAQDASTYDIALDAHVEIDVLQAVKAAATAKWGSSVPATLLSDDATTGFAAEWGWDANPSASQVRTGNFASVRYVGSSVGYETPTTLQVTPLNTVAPGSAAAQLLDVGNGTQGTAKLRVILKISSPTSFANEAERDAYNVAMQQASFQFFASLNDYLNPTSSNTDSWTPTWAAGEGGIYATDSTHAVELGEVKPGDVSQAVMLLKLADPTYNGPLPTLSWALQTEDASDTPEPASDKDKIREATSFVFVNEGGTEIAAGSVTDVNGATGGTFAYGSTAGDNRTNDWASLQAALLRDQPITIDGGTIRRDGTGEIQLDGSGRLVIVVPTSATALDREWVLGQGVSALADAATYKLTAHITDKPSSDDDKEKIAAATSFVIVNNAGTEIAATDVVDVNDLGGFAYGSTAGDASTHTDDWKTLQQALLHENSGAFDPITIVGGTIKRDGDDKIELDSQGRLVIVVPTAETRLRRQWDPSRANDADYYRLSADVSDQPSAVDDRKVIGSATSFVIKSEDGTALAEADVTDKNGLGSFAYGSTAGGASTDDWATLQKALLHEEGGSYKPITIDGGVIQRYSEDTVIDGTQHYQGEIKLEDGKLVIIMPTGTRKADRTWITTRSESAITYKLRATQSAGTKDDLDDKGNALLVIADQQGEPVDVTRLALDKADPLTGTSVPSERRDGNFDKVDSGGTVFEGIPLTNAGTTHLNANIVVIANGARLDSSKAAVVVPEGVKKVEVRVYDATNRPDDARYDGTVPADTSVIEISYVEIESPDGDFPYVVTGDAGAKSVTIAPEDGDAFPAANVSWVDGSGATVNPATLSYTNPLHVRGGDSDAWGGAQMPIWIDDAGRIIVPDDVTDLRVVVTTEDGMTFLTVEPTGIATDGTLIFKGRHPSDAAGTQTVGVQIPSDWGKAADSTDAAPTQQGVTSKTKVEGDGCTASKGTDDRYIVVGEPKVTKVRVTPVYASGDNAYVKATTTTSGTTTTTTYAYAATRVDDSYVPFVDTVIVTPIETTSSANDKLNTVRHADEASNAGTVKVTVVNESPASVTYEDGKIKTVEHPYVVSGMPLADADGTVTEAGKNLKDIVVPDGVTAVRLEVRQVTTGSGSDAVTTTYVTVVPTEWKGNGETPSSAGDKLNTVRHATDTSESTTVAVTIQNKGSEGVRYNASTKKIETVEHPYVVRGADLANATVTETGKNLKDIVIPSDVTAVRLEIEDVTEDGVTVRHVTVVPTARSGETDPAGLNPIKDLTDATDPTRTDGKTMLVIRNADGDIVEPYADDVDRKDADGKPAGVTEGNLPLYRMPEVTVTGGEVDEVTGELLVPSGVTGVRVETKTAADPDDGDKVKISEIILIPTSWKGTDLDDPDDDGKVHIIDESGDVVEQVKPYLSSSVVAAIKALNAAKADVTIWGARVDSLGNLVVPDGTTQARVEPLYDANKNVIGLHVIPVFYRSQLDSDPSDKPVKSTPATAGGAQYLTLVTEVGKAVAEAGPRLDVSKLVSDSDPTGSGDHFYVDGATVDAAGKVQLPRGAVEAAVSIDEASYDASGNPTKITGIKIKVTKWESDIPLQPNDPEDLKKGLKMVEGDINGNVVVEIPTDAPFDASTLKYPITVEGAELDGSIPGYNTLITPDGVTKARIEPTSWDSDGKVTGIKVVPVEWDSRITDDPTTAGKNIDQDPSDTNKTTVVVIDAHGNPIDGTTPAYDEEGNPVKDGRGNTVVTVLQPGGSFDYPIATDVIVRGAYADEDGHIVVPYGVTGVELVPTVSNGKIVEITVNPIRSVQPVDDATTAKPKLSTETASGGAYPHVIHNTDNPASDTVDLHEPGVSNGSEPLPQGYTVSPNLTVEGGRIDGNGNIVVPDDWIEVKVTRELDQTDPTIVTKIVISPTKYGGLNVFEENFEGTGNSKKSVLGDPVKVYPTDTTLYDRSRVTDKTVVSGPELVRVEANVPAAKGTTVGGRNAVMPDGTQAVRITPINGTYTDSYANGALRYNEVYITTIKDTADKDTVTKDKAELLVRNETEPHPGTGTDPYVTKNSENYRPESLKYPDDLADTVTVIGGSFDDDGLIVVPDGIEAVDLDILDTDGDGKIDTIIVKPVRWEGDGDDLNDDDSTDHYLTYNVIDLKGNSVAGVPVYTNGRQISVATGDEAYLLASAAAGDVTAGGKIKRSQVTYTENGVQKPYEVIVKGGNTDPAGNFVVPEGVSKVEVETVIDHASHTITVTLNPVAYETDPEAPAGTTVDNHLKVYNKEGDDITPATVFVDPDYADLDALADALTKPFTVTGAQLDPALVKDNGDGTQDVTYKLVTPEGVTKVRIDIVDYDTSGKPTAIHVTPIEWKGGNSDINTGSQSGWVILSGEDESGTDIKLTPNNFPASDARRTTYADNASFGPHTDAAGTAVEGSGLASKGLVVEGAYVRETTSGSEEDKGKIVLPEGVTEANVAVVYFSSNAPTADDKATYGDDVDTSKIIKLIVTPTKWVAKAPEDDDKFDKMDKQPDGDTNNTDKKADDSSYPRPGIQPKVKDESGNEVEPYDYPYTTTITHLDNSGPVYVSDVKKEGTEIINGYLDDAGDIVVPDGVREVSVDVIGYKDDPNKEGDQKDTTEGAPIIKVTYKSIDVPKSDGDDGKTPIVNPDPDDPSKQSLKIVQDDADHTEIPADKQHRHPKDFDLDELPQPNLVVEGPDVQYDPTTGEIIVPDGVTEVDVEELFKWDDEKKKDVPYGVRITPTKWDGDRGRDDEKLDKVDQDKTEGVVKIRVVDSDNDPVELFPKTISDTTTSPATTKTIVEDSPNLSGSQNQMTLYDTKTGKPVTTLEGKDVTVIGGYVDDTGKIRTPQDVVKALVTCVEYPTGEGADGVTRTRPEVVITITPLEYAKPGSDIKVERDTDGKQTDELVFINEEGTNVQQLPKDGTDHIKKSDLVTSPDELGVIGGRLGPNEEIIAPSGVTEARLVPVERKDPNDPTSKITVVEIVPVTWVADDETKVNTEKDSEPDPSDPTKTIEVTKPVIRPGKTDPALGADDVTLVPTDTKIFEQPLPKGTVVHGGYVSDEEPFTGDIIVPEGVTKVDVYVDESDKDKPIIWIVPTEWKSDTVAEPLDGDEIIKKIDQEPTKDGVTLNAIQPDGDSVTVVPSPVPGELQKDSDGKLLPVTVEGAYVDADGNVVTPPWVKEVQATVEPITDDQGNVIGTKISIVPTKYEGDTDKIKTKDGYLVLVDEDHKDVTEDEPKYKAKNDDGSWNLVENPTIEGAAYDPTTGEIVLPRGTTNARVESAGKDSTGKDVGVVVTGTRFETNGDTEAKGPKTTQIDTGTTNATSGKHNVVFSAADTRGREVSIIANKTVEEAVLNAYVAATTTTDGESFVVNGATVDASGHIQVPTSVKEIGITPVFKTEKDASGNTRYDANGDPIYATDASGNRVIEEIYITYKESQGPVGTVVTDPEDPEKKNRELHVFTEDGTELKAPDEVIYEPEFDPNQLVDEPKVIGDGRIDPEGNIVVPEGTTKVKIEPVYQDDDPTKPIVALIVTVLESISEGGKPEDASLRRWIPRLNIINNDGEWVEDVSNYNAYKLVNDDILIRGGYDRYTKPTNYDLITATVVDGILSVRVEDISWDPTITANADKPHLKTEIEEEFNKNHAASSNAVNPLAALGGLITAAAGALAPAAQDTTSPAGVQDQTVDGIELVVVEAKIGRTPATTTRNVSTLVYVDADGRRVQDGSFDAVDVSKLAKDANGNITATIEGAYVNANGEIVLPSGTGEARVTAVTDSAGNITKLIVEPTMQAPTASSALAKPLTVRDDYYNAVTNVANNLDVNNLATNVTVEGGRIAPDGSLVVERPNATNVVVNGVDTDGDGKIDRIVVIDNTPRSATSDPTVTSVAKTAVNHEGSGTSTLQFVDTRGNPAQDHSNVNLSAANLADNVVVVGADVDASGRIVVPEGVTGVTLDVVRNGSGQVTQITVVPTNRTPFADATNSTVTGLLGEDGKRGAESSQRVKYNGTVAYPSPSEFALTPSQFAPDAEIDGPVTINTDGSLQWPDGVTVGELVPIKRDANGQVIKAEARVRESIKPTSVTPRTSTTSSGLTLKDVSGNAVVDESQDKLDPSKFAANMRIEGAYFDSAGNLVFEDGVQAAMLKATYDESGNIIRIVAQPTRYATDGAAANPTLFDKTPVVHDENNQTVTVEPTVDLSKIHDTITVVGQARVDGSGHIVVPENASKVKIDVEQTYADGSPKVIRVTVTEKKGDDGNTYPVVVGTVFEHNGNQKRSTVTMITEKDKWMRDDSTLTDPGDPITEGRMSPDGVRVITNDGIVYDKDATKRLIAPEGSVGMKLTYETDKGTGKITQVTASLTEKEADDPAGTQENSASFRKGSGNSGLMLFDVNGKAVADKTTAALDLTNIEKGVKVVGAALDGEGNFVLPANATGAKVTTADVNGDGSPDRIVIEAEYDTNVATDTSGSGTRQAAATTASSSKLPKTGDPAIDIGVPALISALSGIGLLLVARELKRLQLADERDAARERAGARRTTRQGPRADVTSGGARARRVSQAHGRNEHERRRPTRRHDD